MRERAAAEKAEVKDSDVQRVMEGTETATDADGKVAVRSRWRMR